LRPTGPPTSFTEPVRLWFFDRDNESLRLETRYDNDTHEFVAVVHYPDGQELHRRFKEGDAFRVWLQAFERALGVKRWRGRGGPIVLPYGWPNQPLD
jgi:hypothetical protein